MARHVGTSSLVRACMCACIDTYICVHAYTSTCVCTCTLHVRMCVQLLMKRQEEIKKQQEELLTKASTSAGRYPNAHTGMHACAYARTRMCARMHSSEEEDAKKKRMEFLKQQRDRLMQKKKEEREAVRSCPHARSACIHALIHALVYTAHAQVLKKYEEEQKTKEPPKPPPAEC